MERIVLKGCLRRPKGSREAQRLRKQGWVPANLYGHGEANVSFQVPEEEVRNLVDEGHHLLSIDLDGKVDQGLMKELQFDAYGEKIIHIDFARISLEEVVETSVPVETFGVPKGLTAGGTLDVIHHELVLRGKARDIPEHLPVEIGALHVGESVRVRELALPEGIEAVLGPEEAIVIIHAPKGRELPEEGEGAEEAQTPVAEPVSAAPGED
ncbi:MAG: 50S ribosomal protein L25 [Planctomycetota bacterium]